MKKMFQVIGPGRMTVESETVRYSSIRKIETKRGTLLYYERVRGERPDVLIVGYLLWQDAELTPGTEVAVNAIDSQQEEAFARETIRHVADGDIVFFE